MFGVQKQNIERCNLSKQIISQPKLYIVRAQSTNLFQQEIVQIFVQFYLITQPDHDWLSP